MLGRVGAWVALSALVLSGCGGGDDDDEASATSGLAGIYETQSDAYSEPCDAPGIPGTAPPYFTIVDESFLGVPFINVYSCTSADAASCEGEDNGSPLVFLAEKTNGGVFHSESSTRIGGDTSCTASHHSDDIAKSAAGVTITSEELSGEWSGDDCTAEFTQEVADKTKSLPCASRELWSGRRISDN
jgi:hypothetical protein